MQNNPLSEHELPRDSIKQDRINDMKQILIMKKNQNVHNPKCNESVQIYNWSLAY